jgi:hypothetical protein
LCDDCGIETELRQVAACADDLLCCTKWVCINLDCRFDCGFCDQILDRNDAEDAAFYIVERSEQRDVRIICKSCLQRSLQALLQTADMYSTDENQDLETEVRKAVQALNDDRDFNLKFRFKEEKYSFSFGGILKWWGMTTREKDHRISNGCSWAI